MADFTDEEEMHVLKRNGNYQEVSFDKILNRVKNLGSQTGITLNVKYGPLVMKVIDQFT